MHKYLLTYSCTSTCTHSLSNTHTQPHSLDSCNKVWKLSNWHNWVSWSRRDKHGNLRLLSTNTYLVRLNTWYFKSYSYPTAFTYIVNTSSKHICCCNNGERGDACQLHFSIGGSRPIFMKGTIKLFLVFNEEGADLTELDGTRRFPESRDES